MLSKHKTDTNIQFIDASGEDYFEKATNTNVLTEEHIVAIMQAFDTKENVDHFARSIDSAKIADKEYNLAVSTYVQPKDTREKVDIVKLNAKLKTTVARIDELRSEIDSMVAKIEGKDIGA